MIFNPTKSLGALALVLALGACETGTSPAGAGGVGIMAHLNASGIETTKLIVEGNESNIVLSNEPQIEAALAAFGGTGGATNLGAMIQQIRLSNMMPNVDVPGLTGLGGIFGNAFLDLSRQTLHGGGNGHFNPAKRVVVSLSGRILDYSYDDSTGSGMIEAITYVTHRVVPASGQLTPAHTDAYKFKVRVDPGGYTVVPHSNNRDDPFPNTLAFSEPLKDRVESLGFRHKLWATGTSIVVEEVRLDQNYNPNLPHTPNWLDLSNIPKYARLFQTSDNSCIDMMFVDFPPATFGELEAPPFSCLGRCADPLLINTR